MNNQLSPCHKRNNLNHSELHTPPDNKNTSRTLMSDRKSAFQKISLSEIIPDWKETSNRLSATILPEPLIKPLRNKNPHIDSSQPNEDSKNFLGTGVDRVAQRQINALLAHDENMQERRLKAVLNSEVLKDLNKLGVSLMGNGVQGYYLKGNKTGRELHIPDAHIRYAMTLIRQIPNENFDYRDVDLDRVRVIGEALHRANKKLSTPVTLDQLLDRYFIFGGCPTAVTQHFDPEIRPTVNAIAKELHVPLRDAGRVKKPKILLYTTIGGGGHLAHTKAIDKHLQALGIETKIMNNDANVFDPLSYLTDGEASQFDPYNRVIQRRIGLDGRALRDDKEMRAEFEKYDYIVDVLHALSGTKNHFEIARYELRDPDYVALIDSLPHLTGIEGAAISNGVRYIRWATDLDTWVPLLKSYDVMNANQGKIALTSGDPIANRELSPQHRRQGDIWKKEILKQDSDIEINPEILEDPRVFIAGYPIRPEINKLSLSERNYLRSSIGLSPTDQLVIVMMGSQGKRELIDLMQQLLERPPENHKGKLNVVFAVGSNIPLKKDLINLVSQSGHGNKVEIRMADELLGTPDQALDAKQMNVLYNTADLLISKPGGSVTAEVLENETPTLMCALNRGEEGNASYLLRSGLGVMRDDNIPLCTQVEALLSGEKRQLNPKFKLPAWRSSVKTMLEDFIGIKTKKEARHSDAEKKQEQHQSMQISPNLKVLEPTILLDEA